MVQRQSGHGESVLGGEAEDLDADAKVDVDMADYSVASKGDAITVTGPAARQAIQADSVTIQLTEPLGGGAKKKPLKKHAPAKKGGSGDDAGDSKADKKAAGD